MSTNIGADPLTSTEAVPTGTTDSQLQWTASEELLALPDGRTLAYSHSGPSDSNTVVLWCHGLFSVGDASNPPRPMKQRNARFVAASLPGWGNTSPLAPGKTFPETVVSDTRALFEHLYPSHDGATSELRIYVSGGSFGTCPAQILSGAPYDRFPFGRQIVAVVLAAPFSPFREDKNYSRSLNWRDWFGVGAPAIHAPFNLTLRSLKLAMQSKVRDIAAAETLLRGMFFDNMDKEERERFAEWRARNGVPEGRFERRMAEGMAKSVSKSWEGFLGTARALHADWGFRIKELDEDHQRRLVVVVVGQGDTSMFNMSKYLVENYKRTKVVEYSGGHLSGAWSMDKIWEETFVEIEGTAA